MENTQAQLGPIATDPPRIGETVAEQAAPVSIVAKERMVEIIANTGKITSDAQACLDLLNERPELDAVFCRMFGIKKNPGMVDVTGR